MENKRKTVEEFLAKGERLMEDPKSPKFLETHVNKLKEAWDVAIMAANVRKKDLLDNLEAWKTFEAKKVECGKSLDSADHQLKSIRKNYHLEKGPAELTDKMKIAATMRFEIEDLFGQTENANNILQKNLPLEMKDGMNNQVQGLRDRVTVLENIDRELANIFQFNQQLKEFDEVLTHTTDWVHTKAKGKLDIIRAPEDFLLPPDPEERVGKVLELSEDLTKRSKICSSLEEKREGLFPQPGEKTSKDAKELLERLKSLRAELTGYEQEANKDFEQFSKDVRFFAEYQTGLQEFYPQLLAAEQKIINGITIPKDLASALELKADTESFLTGLQANFKTLDEAEQTAKNMTHHAYCDTAVSQFRERCTKAHITASEWMEQVLELVNSWSNLEGKVGNLGALVSTSPAADPDIPIEKLEEELINLKLCFAQKQEMVKTLQDKWTRSEEVASPSANGPPNIKLRRLTLAPQPISRGVSIASPVAEKSTTAGL